MTPPVAVDVPDSETSVLARYGGIVRVLKSWCFEPEFDRRLVAAFLTIATEIEDANRAQEKRSRDANKRRFVRDAEIDLLVDRIFGNLPS